ncbi:MAG: ABC transporter ATP-binding protein [Syntrophobacteraceae bacterium]
MNEQIPLHLDVRDLSVSFPGSRGPVRILEGVSFSLRAGEVLALVGETGCGKSVTAKTILNLIPRLTCERDGLVQFERRNLLKLSNRELQAYRGRRISMVFQNPQSSINPVFTLGEQLKRLIRKHLVDEIDSLRHSEEISLRQAVHRLAREKLLEVGLTDVERLLKSYPHQISGGMAQRYRIATALLGSPEILIADEATSALDVTVQAHILNLLKNLCRQKGTAILFITHDLGIAAQICDRVAVMYAGRIIETAPTVELFEKPLHPYTRGLLKAVPRLGQKTRLEQIPGMIPDLANPPGGCRFHPRCAHRLVRCEREKPARSSVGVEHRVACHLYPAEDRGEHNQVVEAAVSRGADG